MEQNNGTTLGAPAANEAVAILPINPLFMLDKAPTAEYPSTQAALANGLYRQLVALANAGQAAWRLTDAQKAHEYVIDPTVASAEPVPVPVPPQA